MAETPNGKYVRHADVELLVQAEREKVSSLITALSAIQSLSHGGNSDIYQIASKAITEAVA